MTTTQHVLRRILVAGTFFLALTAIPGGVMLLLGIYAPPVEMLRGSYFTSFTIPGLALALLVGGSAIGAALLLIRRSSAGLPGAAIAGLVVMTFEFIQVIAIGSPPGPSRIMQLLYFTIGALLVIAAMAASFLSPGSTA